MNLELARDAIASGRAVGCLVGGLSAFGDGRLGASLPKHSELADYVSVATPVELDGYDYTSSIEMLLEQPTETVAEVLTSVFEVTNETSEMVARFANVPFGRLYNLTYSNIAEVCASRYPNRRISNVNGAVDTTAPTSRAIQWVDVFGRCSAAGSVISPRLQTDLDTPAEVWLQELAAQSQTRPFFLLADELEAASDQLLSFLGRGSNLRIAIGTGSSVDRKRLEYYGFMLPGIDLAEFLSTELDRQAIWVLTGATRLEARLDQTEKSGSVQFVTDLVPTNPEPSREFLRGAQPTWHDAVGPWIVHRQWALDIVKEIEELPERSNSRSVAPVFLATGQAGAGKSAVLMQAAIALEKAGLRVGWLDRRAHAKLRDIRNAIKRLQFDVLIVDDVDIFGDRARHFLKEASATCQVAVLAATRSTRLRLIESPDFVRRDVSPVLNHKEIGDLIGAIRSAGYAGELMLLGSDLERQAWVRDQMGSDLLATLVRVVTGKQLEDRVLEELGQLSKDERSLYELICFLSAIVFEAIETPDTDILQMTSEQPPYTRALDSLRHLAHVGLIFYDIDDTSGVRTRHRVIAELVFEEMLRRDEVSSNRTVLHLLHTSVRYYAARVRSMLNQFDAASIDRRHQVRLTNHNVMIQAGLSLKEGRAIYKSVQADLEEDFHYWLQFSSYEFERGDPDLAWNYIMQARSCTPDRKEIIVETHATRVALRLSTMRTSDLPWAETAEQELKSLIGLVEGSEARSPHTFTALLSEGTAWAESHHLLADESRLQLRHELTRISVVAERLFPDNGFVVDAIADARKTVRASKHQSFPL